MESQDSPTPAEAPVGLTPAQRVFVYIGSIGPLGFAPMSGTVAVAAAGIPLAWVLTTHLSTLQYAIFVVLYSVAAMVYHHFGDRVLGETDSRKLVLDELAGFFVAMFMIPWNWRIVTVAFFLERFLDIVKVPPANIIDRRTHNGFGVVADDLVAGAYTCVILHLLLRFGPTWLMPS